MSKVFAALLLYAAAVVASAARTQIRYHGQDIYAEPDCSIVEDQSRKFRDISNPTYYWVCPEGQEKANYIQCPDNYAFMEKEQVCVVWEEWKWIEPYTK